LPQESSALEHDYVNALPSGVLGADSVYPHIRVIRMALDPCGVAIGAEERASLTP